MCNRPVPVWMQDSPGDRQNLRGLKKSLRDSWNRQYNSYHYGCDTSDDLVDAMACLMYHASTCQCLSSGPCFRFFTPQPIRVRFSYPYC